MLHKASARCPTMTPPTSRGPLSPPLPSRWRRQHFAGRAQFGTSRSNRLPTPVPSLTLPSVTATIFHCLNLSLLPLISPAPSIFRCPHAVCTGRVTDRLEPQTRLRPSIRTHRRILRHRIPLCALLASSNLSRIHRSERALFRALAAAPTARPIHASDASPSTLSFGCASAITSERIPVISSSPPSPFRAISPSMDSRTSLAQSPSQSSLFVLEGPRRFVEIAVAVENPTSSPRIRSILLFHNSPAIPPSERAHAMD
ncbi:hypothetical protein EXIGLDRAFT_424327 [Exidia glandulosa HHB12029]|uniref:Uncharacterized protein n=1 Tax=Exidia glandulosa HHB12029 TaxID=1314781 RepID=A0A165KK99_EXIGL|nr:hypothetical protein EXIGLDRAFT_424327 [Exidia glandulosa HHB12029]